MKKELSEDERMFRSAIKWGVGVGTVLIAAVMGGCPVYNVWEQGLAGEAELRRAEQNRQIRINEAQAKKDAAVHEMEAEITRAKGVAEANKIIGESLKKNESYLRYLWITEVASNETGKTTVYVPTEANMPILEAGRTNGKGE